MATTSPSSRTPLYLGCGCFGCLGLICLVSVGSFGAWRWVLAQSATSHAVTFFQALVRRDYPSAYGSAISQYDTNLYSLSDFTTCMQATPLATMTDVTCHGADVAMDASSADVSCTITTPTGPIEVVLDVNDPTQHPYNGFVWFAPSAAVGPAWHGDTCATWSGREYYREPPAGMVRP